MPTNNPNHRTSSQPTPRGATEATSSTSTRAGEAATRNIEQTGQRVEKGIDRVEKGAEQVATRAIERVREAREQATSGLVQQRDYIATRIHKVGTLLRSGSETLAEDDPLAYNVLQYVGQSADGLADYLRDATPGSLGNDLQSFARRRSGMFFGGAFLIGLALGRFVKSSTAPSAGGERDDRMAYGEADEARENAGTSYAQPRGTPAAVAPGYGGPSTYEPPAPAPATSATGTSTALPYVSAGSNAIGVTPSSATYGASTSAGTSGTESVTPSYGSATSGTSTASVVTRPSQLPPLREAPDEKASPRAHSVREGEGTKS